jgi:inosine/xanthosine triphosphatase
MKRLVLASTNPVKAQATLTGFQCMFPDEIFELVAVTVASGVSEQPLSSDEVLRGALNRAQAARRAVQDGDYWIGIEGGVEDNHGKQGTMEMYSLSWVVVVADGLTGKGRTGTFILPEAVASLVRQGKDLGEADDIVFKQSNSKQKNGAIGLLTGDVIDRAGLYEQAVILALVPFKNKDLYAG